jgi:hypothetical protein
MDTKYTVRFTGELRSEFKFEDVVTNFVAITKMDRGMAEQRLSSGQPVLIKKDVDRETADKYYFRFTEAGLLIELIESDSQPSASTVVEKTEEVRKETPAPAMSQAPSAETPPPPIQEPVPDNPYAAPRADLKVEKKEASGNWLDKPQKVAGSRGWYWVKTAIGLFMAEPWKWLGMTFVVMLITIPLSLLPFVGSLINIFLGLLLGGGMIMGAHEQAEGGTLTFGHLFKGFKHNRNQLLMIGVIYLAFFILIGAGIGLLAGTGALAMFGIGGDPEAAAMAMQNNLSMFWIIMLVVLALSIPLMSAYWFTTPLVALSDRKALTSYKLSFQGCLKNWLAFLVYGLAFFAIGIIITIAFSVVSGLVTLFLGNDGSMFVVVLPMVILAFLGFPLITIGGLSVYTSFRDIFYRTA